MYPTVGIAPTSLRTLAVSARSSWLGTVNFSRGAYFLFFTTLVANSLYEWFKITAVARSAGLLRAGTSGLSVLVRYGSQTVFSPFSKSCARMVFTLSYVFVGQTGSTPGCPAPAAPWLVVGPPVV